MLARGPLLPRCADHTPDLAGHHPVDRGNFASPPGFPPTWGMLFTRAARQRVMRSRIISGGDRCRIRPSARCGHCGRSMHARGGTDDTIVAQGAVAHARPVGVRGPLDLDLVRVLELAVLRRGDAAQLVGICRRGRRAFDHRARAAVGDVAAGERGDHRVFAAALLPAQPVVRREGPSSAGRRAHRAGHRRHLPPRACRDG